MYKKVGFMLSICLFILSGCMNSSAYKDEDVAAIVRGEEISVGSLRFLYPDEAIIEMVDEVVVAKLAEQEVKKMNIDITDKVEEEKQSYGKYPQKKLNSADTQSIRAFADPQAKKLGIDPREYYKVYTKLSAEMGAYINTYISNILGELEEDEFGIEEYAHHANEVLEHLVEQNKHAIEVRIK